MKIGTKINLSFLVTFVLIFSLFGSFIFAYTANLVKQNTYSHLYTSGRATAEHVRTFIQKQEKIVKILAATSVYQDFLKEPRDSDQYAVAKEKINRQLKGVLAADAQIYEIFILDANGKVIVSSDMSQEGKDESDDSYFINAKNDVFFKDFYFSSTINEITYAIAAPVEDINGVFLGVLVLKYLSDEFYLIVKNENGLGDTEENFLINKDRFFITPSHFLGNGVILKEKVDTQNTKDCYDPKEMEYIRRNGYGGLRDLFGAQIVEAKDYRNVDVIATHTFIPETDWCLVTKVDKADLLSFEQVLIGVFVIIFVIAGLIILLISLLISKNITNSISFLIIGIEKIKAGNFSGKLKIEVKDEIGILAEAFNEMIARLADIYGNMEKLIKKRTEELEEKNKALEKNGIEIKKALDKAERANKLMVGRELKMTELKKEIAELKSKLQTRQ